jgi:hypothetical protein
MLTVVEPERREATDVVVAHIEAAGAELICREGGPGSNVRQNVQPISLRLARDASACQHARPNVEAGPIR